jgi:tRNA pseudouridine55 synthase
MSIPILSPQAILNDNLLDPGGVLLIDKPLHWTSFDVVNKVRYALRKSFGLKKLKVGHAGTLDPLATGLLIVCTGKMTPRINELMDQDKIYTGSICLGFSTPSFDAETERIPGGDINDIQISDITQAARKWTGSIEQIPPMYSAVKQGGKKLYDLARKGIEVEVKSRQVSIHEFSIVDYNPPFVDFRISCSKGTYIRSLAHDLGQTLGCGAYLTSLCRTHSGVNSLQDAWQLEDLIAAIDRIQNA